MHDKKIVEEMEALDEIDLTPGGNKKKKSGEPELSKPDLLNHSPVTLKRKILVIEDDENSLAEIKNYLDGRGFQVLDAKDGREGISIISKHPSIAAIFMDLKMPHMNGIQFIKTMRSMQVLEDVPLVVMSGYLNEGVISKIKELRVAGCIVKPYKLNIFDEYLDKFHILPALETAV